MSEPAEPTVSADAVSEILRGGASAETKLRRVQRLVDAALRPSGPPRPVEHDAGGWPRLRPAQGADTGSFFYTPPPTYDPRD